MNIPSYSIPAGVLLTVALLITQPVSAKNNETIPGLPSANVSLAYHTSDTGTAVTPLTGTDAVAHSTSDIRMLPARPGPRYVSLQEVGNNGWNSGIMRSISENPGYAFLSSAVIPGLGQAANRQWWKTALFVAVETTAIGVFIHRENHGRDGERYYEEFGDEHWSVVQYAQYIIANHQHQHGIGFRDIIEDGVAYNENEPFGGIEPAFDTDTDWAVINREALNEAERNSRFANGNLFSHSVEPYGSQQYYELMSKYSQFGPGWRDWNNDIHSIDDKIKSEKFLYHARIGFDFNDDLSVARNMITLLVANHFIAAFDAYFTQKLREARVQPSASMEYGLRPTFGFHYRF